MIQQKAEFSSQQSVAYSRNYLLEYGISESGLIILLVSMTAVD